jgi:uncharacterized protein YndB with AHSA1/START domain
MGKLPDIEQSFYLEAPPSKVFAALTDSKVLSRWFAVKAKIDQGEGGWFSLTMKNGFVWEGKLSGCRVNKSVSYPWVEGTASFGLAGKGRGTMLRLNHTGFETADALVQSSAGWSYYLTNLKSVLDHGTDLRSKDDSF